MSSRGIVYVVLSMRRSWMRSLGSQSESHPRPAPKLKAAIMRSLRALDFFGGGVPCHRIPTEIRFIGHVARQRRVMSKYDIFCNRLPRAHRLEKIPEMRLQFAGRRGSISETFFNRFFA